MHFRIYRPILRKIILYFMEDIKSNFVIYEIQNSVKLLKSYFNIVEF